MILDRIAESTRKRVEKAKYLRPFDVVKREAFADARQCADFGKALSTGDISCICEVKKASPSKGVIAADFPYTQIAQDYERSGASAISVLTEPDYFQGSDAYLSEIKSEVSIPVLRKDFTVDEYQIYEAKLIGADAVLLICSLLSTEQLKTYLKVCGDLGLHALVEAHDEAEIDSALDAGAEIVGVNNRDLKTFEVDLGLCIKLRKAVPRQIVFVAESGIKTAHDIKRMREAQVDAVLIGETLMRSPDKKATLDELRGDFNDSN